MINRRRFLQATAGAAAFLTLSRRARAFEQSPTNLRKYVVGLPGLGSSAQNEIGQYIPVASPNTKLFPGNDYYTLLAAQYEELMHPDLPKATKLWGYADLTPLIPNGPQPGISYSGLAAHFRYLGPIIQATSGRPVRWTAFNGLPSTHILPVDTDLFFTNAVPSNKMCVHLHGNFSPWISDGGPAAWFTPAGGPVGPNYGFQALDMVTIPGACNYYHPNQQSARLLWYHDHGMDLTRLNVYAGLVSGYILSDAAEARLVSAGIVPSAQLPLIIQDKSFKSVPDQWGEPGDLWYPSVYEGPPIPNMTYSDLGTGTGRWERGGSPILPLPYPSDVPEAFQDTILVNGTVYPYLNVQGKRYRFRILSGSNARFFNLQLCVADGTKDGITLVPTGGIDNNGNPILAPRNAAGPAFLQIGNEAGFLPAPVLFGDGTNHNSNMLIGYDLRGNVNTNPTWGNVNRHNLLLAPAERADVIIDFRGFEGQDLILYSDAPAPFPGGDIRNDYFTGAPNLTSIGGAPTPQDGFSPGTRTLMRINVGAQASDNMTFLQTLESLEAALPLVFAETQPPIPSSGPVRPLTLNEDYDQYGRLIQRIGTTSSYSLNNEGEPTYGLAYLSLPTETPRAGATEIWQIFNRTGDTHPVHFHLVNVHIISRASWPGVFNDDFTAIGPERPPDANEMGWKETVRMNPGEVIKVIMTFKLPEAPSSVFNPAKQLSTWTGVTGYEYVYHCHILEHEEHDMMRPLIVVP